MGALTCNIQDYTCPRCTKNFGYLYASGTGFMYFCGDPGCLQEDSDASKSSIKKTQEIKDFDAAHRFGIGSKYVNASLTKWNANPQHSEYVSRWLRSPKEFLVLTGKVKTGKTYFCAAVANYLMEQKRSVRYYNSHRLVEEVQKGMGKDSSPYDVINKMAAYDYFILDDLGSSLNTEWQKEMFLDLIDQRYSNSKPTIITTNLNKDEIKAVLGERTSRRIFSEENLVITLGPEYVR